MSVAAPAPARTGRYDRWVAGRPRSWSVWSAVVAVAAALATAYATLGASFYAAEETIGILCSSACPDPGVLDWARAAAIGLAPSALFSIGMVLWRRRLRWLWAGAAPALLVGSAWLYFAVA